MKLEPSNSNEFLIIESFSSTQFKKAKIKICLDCLSDFRYRYTLKKRKNRRKYRITCMSQTAIMMDHWLNWKILYTFSSGFHSSIMCIHSTCISDFPPVFSFRACPVNYQTDLWILLNWENILHMWISKRRNADTAYGKKYCVAIYEPVEFSSLESNAMLFLADGSPVL